MGSFIYKPNTYKGPVFLAKGNNAGKVPVIKTSDGQEIRGTLVNVVDEGGGPVTQWKFPTSVWNLSDLTLEYDGQSGSISSGGQSYEGDNIGSWQARAKGSLGSGGASSGSYPSQFTPGNIGYGAYPAYVGNLFPKAVTTKYNPIDYKGSDYKSIDYKGTDYTNIDTAPYNFTDPQNFASSYGEFNRQEINKNYNQSRALALDTLNTELQSLQAYVPATAALQRSQTSLDNQFNQSQRDAQLASTMPDARSSLEAQAARMNTYASGKVPDAVQDSALNLNTRSTAADIGAASGFGAGSGQSQKIGDLMTAEQRLQLAQYGESGISSNLTQRNTLLSAPLEYSNAASKVNINPSLSSSQLTQSNLGELNNQTLVSSTNALQSNVQQNQFQTSLEDTTRRFNATNTLQNAQFNASNVFAKDKFNASNILQNDQFNVSNVFAKDRFNATNTLQNDQFNAGNLNNFALQKFNYDATYAGALAGANQTNINTQFSLEQQAKAEALAREYMAMAQNAATTQSWANGLTSILGGLGGFFESISSLFGGSSKNPVTSTDPNSGLDSSGNFNPGNTDFYYSPSDTGNTGDYTNGSSSDGSTSTGNYGVETTDSTRIPDIQISDSELVTPSEAQYSNAVGTSTTSKGNTVTASNAFADQNTSPDTIFKNAMTDLVKSGFEVSKSSDGTVKVSPSVINDPVVKSYESATGTNLSSTSPGIIKAALNGGKAVLNAAGIKDTPTSTTVFKGYDTTGKPTYAEQRIDQSNDATEGQTQMNFLKKALDPLGAFSKEDSNIWDKMATATGDASILLGLSTAASNRDLKGFTDILTRNFGKVASEAVSDKTTTQAGIQSGMEAYLLFSNWDNMSMASKGRGLAAMAIKGYQAATGENLANTPVITRSDGSTALNVGGALDLLSTGINVYSLANNWNDLNDVQKVIYGTGTAAQVAHTADKLGLLGSGTSGSALTPAASAQIDTLISSGKAVSASGTGLGVDAVAFKNAADMPTSMIAVDKTADGIIAVPKASMFTGVAGGAAVVAGVYNVASNWGEGGAKGALQGGIGGGAIVGGLAAMQEAGWIGAAGPYAVPIAAGIIGVSVLGDMLKTGKQEDQVKRDSVRDAYANIGLTDKDSNVTLADGTKYSIGIDGHGDEHTFTNLDKRAADQQDRTVLHSYDIDYTNDLDYAFSTAGVTLSRLALGEKGTNVDQMGGQLTNAALSSVGYGKALSQENFNKVASNMRAMYSQAGIKDKNTAYALANKAYSEGRISAVDHFTAQRAADMIYDKDGFSKAKDYADDGRYKGIEAAESQDKTYQADKKKEANKKKYPTNASELPSDMPAERKAERIAAAKAHLQGGSVADTETSATPSPKEQASPKETSTQKPSIANPGKIIKPASSKNKNYLTKEQLQALNRRRYNIEDTETRV